MTEEQLPGGGTVFGIGRRKSQGQLARAELNQSISHLMQAANHAAKGAGASVGPRVQAARGFVAPTAAKVRDRAATGWGTTLTTLAPLAAVARDGAGQAGSMTRKAKAKNMRITGKKKQPRRRGSMMTGLLAAGAVAGLAGAMAMRRRREQQEWAEYDPTRTLEPMRDEVDTIEVKTRSGGGSGVTDASTMSSGSGVAGGPTGAGSSAVAGGDSASTTSPGVQPTIQATEKVPSVAEGARDVSGRPADDLSKALGKNTARTNGRR
ncbi:hypothetical protein Q3W71_17745 [Micromonospora sp. C28SCA-DRY-2]|uniref:hypothetical protein n=1 Tax=Micromonospora sp. C28SCA-DRY-2 TaxID=3059522 RepID=UPI00267598EB|nr:hypothetical protein [Micromonospora sp. C28SCA-DRY-2]MDO3703517.1 hypothetical protein [Micromonospora sp. C28SCA-DRY-2]